MGLKITLMRPDGEEASRYLAKAGRATALGIVANQERRGCRIRSSADAIALC
jgi:hypothetical protein